MGIDLDELRDLPQQTEEVEAGGAPMHEETVRPRALHTETSSDRWS